MSKGYKQLTRVWIEMAILSPILNPAIISMQRSLFSEKVPAVIYRENWKKSYTCSRPLLILRFTKWGSKRFGKFQMAISKKDLFYIVLAGRFQKVKSEDLGSMPLGKTRFQLAMSSALIPETPSWMDTPFYRPSKNILR